MAEGLHEGDIPLAGYMLARQADGRPVEGADLDLLRDAHASVREARELLPLGRGNVREDLRATHGLSRWASGHMRELIEKEMPHKPAVAMLTFEAGACDEYAVLTGLSLAARMREDVHARIARNARKPIHAWTEAARNGNFDDRSHTVVLDAWCSGPAVFAPDSKFGSAARVEARDSHGIEYLTKGSHGEVLEKAKAEARGMSISKPSPPPWHGPYPDPSAFSCYPVYSLRSSVKPEFTQRAKAILTAEITPEKAYSKAPTSPGGEPPVREEGRKGIPAELRSSIQAVGVARQLAPGMNVKAFAKTASKIVDVATKLDNAVYLNPVPNQQHVTQLRPARGKRN